MSPQPAPRQEVRAGVPGFAADIIRARAPQAEVVVIDELDDLRDFDFIVPLPRGQSELAGRLPELERLAVIQTLSAGVDELQDRIPARVTLCSARGARDDAVAEWVLGALLGSTTRVLEKRGVRHWTREVELVDLSEWTVLIVGMGSIGERVGALLAAFGTTVVGVVSRARGDLRGIDELAGLLPEADAVVILTPLTTATTGLVDAAALARMRDGALLVNAARGAVVDTEALVAETQSGRLRAVLDVTDPEPLPDGHPLWTAPGVLSITPHIGGDSPRAHRRAAELAGDQLARFCAGEPLVNVVQNGAPS